MKETKRPWPKPDFSQGPTHPAVNVSWDDAQLFRQWLNARDKAAGLLPSGWRYRLPGDHEWSCAGGLGESEDAAKLPTEKYSMIDDVFPWGAQWPPPNGAGNFAGEELRPAFVAGKFTYATKVDLQRSFWAMDTNNPPLSVKQAVAKAQPVLMKLLGTDKGWWGYSVSLIQPSSKRWVYEVEYLGPSNSDSRAQIVTLFVFLDGYVPEPKSKPRDSNQAPDIR